MPSAVPEKIAPGMAVAVALAAHFAVPELQAFAKAVRAMAVEPPTLNIYEAEAIRP